MFYKGVRLSNNSTAAELHDKKDFQKLDAHLKERCGAQRSHLARFYKPEESADFEAACKFYQI